MWEAKRKMYIAPKSTNTSWVHYAQSPHSPSYHGITWKQPSNDVCMVFFYRLFTDVSSISVICCYHRSSASVIAAK